QSPGFWDGIPRELDSTYSIVGSFPTTRLLPVHPFWPSTLVIRRDYFDTLNGWNQNLKGIKSEDNEFSFRAIKNGRLGLIWSPTVRYRTHPGNDSSSSLLNALGRTQIWEILLLSQELTDSERNGLNNAINNALHETIFSAFFEKQYGVVLQVSKKISKYDLTIPEKIKIALSKAIAGMSSIKKTN
ncbi:MAG: hypothetical protein ABI476_04030, partial [Oxalobacteraceae bacterium]